MHKWEREKRSENRKNVSICCRGGVCPSRRYTADSHRPPSKRRWPPTGSVAVFPERPVGDIQPQKCSGAPLHRPDVSLRGGRRPTWQSREGTHDFTDRFPTIQSGAARLHPKGTSSRFALRAPRRFAPRNDTSSSAEVHQCSRAIELLCPRRSLTTLGSSGFLCTPSCGCDNTIKQAVYL